MRSTQGILVYSRFVIENSYVGETAQNLLKSVTIWPTYREK